MPVSTLAEVAHLAGVSLSTASRVLNGSARTPGHDITTRVRKAAETLGYIPNAQAQGLAKARSGLMGLIVHDIADPYFAAIARGVQQAAREQRRTVLLATTDGTPDGERAAVAAFAAHRTDSIVIAGSRSGRPQDQASNVLLAAELDRYCRNGGLVGVIGYPIIGATAPEGYHVVPIPNEELAAELANKLANTHQRKFIIMAGPDGRLASEDRIRGFQQGLAEAGMPPAAVVKTSFDRNGGYTAGLDLADRIKSHGRKTPRTPLCVLAGNDVMALGVTAALRSEGLRIPQDVIISGFDGIEMLHDLAPALPTVQLPLELIGRLATMEPGPEQQPAIEGEVVMTYDTSLLG